MPPRQCTYGANVLLHTLLGLDNFYLIRQQLSGFTQGWERVLETRREQGCLL